MQYRPVGDSDLEVSAVAYGNWLTHGSLVEDSQAARCVRAALDVGITTFDTADIYADGRAEAVLGAALEGVRRDSIVIATKVGLRPERTAQDRDLSAKHILASCHRSLRRLGTDYIDLYQAHRFDSRTPLDETLSAMSDLVRRGDVRYVGVSEWTATQLSDGQQAAEQAGIRLVSNQPQYSLLWRVIEPEVIPKSMQLGIGQVAFSPLAQGVLTGKYQPSASWPARSRAASDSGTGSITRCLSPELLDRVRLLRPTAESLGLTMAQLALAWVLQRRGIAAAIAGASSPVQIRENAAAAEITVESAVIARIDEVLGDMIDRDPTKAGRTYDVMPAWRLPQ